MAAFLTTDAISSEIRRIISDARSEITILSPYLNLPDPLFEQLRESYRAGAGVKLAYSRASFTSEQEKWLRKTSHVVLYRFDNLNANCYFNEDRMIITSMGVGEYSRRAYREMGVLLRRSRDKESFRKAVNEVESILTSAKRIDPQRDNLSSGGISFFKDDLDRTVQDLRAAVAFLKKDLEKTKEDLNKEITFRSKRERGRNLSQK